MASSFCHVVGVAKQVRLERIVRRDHPAEVKRPQGCLNRSLDSRAHPANCQRQTLRSRTRWAGNVPASTRHAATEADERTDVMLECSNGEVSEAGRPKPATTGVEWPPDATEAVNRFSSRFDAPNNYSTSGKRRCTEYAIPAPRAPPERKRTRLNSRH